MDADDVARPTRLERQLELMESTPALTGCGCGVEYFPEDRVRAGARRYERWINAAVTPDQIEQALFVECPIPHPTFFLRADRVAAVGGYRDPGWPEDYDLVLRLWMAGGRFGKVPEPLLRWREGATRLSRRHPRYAPDAFRRCKADYLSRTFLAEGRTAVIWGAGPVGKGLSRALATAGSRIEAFVDVDPRKVGQEIHGVPVLAPREALLRKGPLHLAAVGKGRGRAAIRALLEHAGMRVLADFLEAA
jgi:hypothetical protein